MYSCQCKKLSTGCAEVAQNLRAMAKIIARLRKNVTIVQKLHSARLQFSGETNITNNRQVLKQQQSVVECRNQNSQKADKNILRFSGIFL